MTAGARWHPSQDGIREYVTGQLDRVSASSVEAHLLTCGPCRSLVRAHVPTARLDAMLSTVEDRLDARERPRVERVVRRLGMDEPDARALLAAPSVRIAWWGAVGLACLLAFLVEAQESPRMLFLLLAPLLPVISTAAAYAPGLDPALPIVMATPYRTSRLLLARSLAVGATAAAGASLAGLGLPGQRTTMVLWLLPALALTSMVLALSPWLGTGLAAGTVGGGWVLAVGLLEHRGADPLVAFHRDGQLLSALLAAVALAVVASHQRHLDEGARR